MEQTWNKEWPGLLLNHPGENNARDAMVAFKLHIKPIIYVTVESQLPLLQVH